MSIDSRQCMENVCDKIADEELEKIIRGRLHKNPLFYLNFLKKLIDEIDEIIPDEVLFDLLQPSFAVSDGGHKRNKCSGANDISEGLMYEDLVLLPSPESIDMLFRPGVRKKIYEWQCASFAKGLETSQRKEAKDKIRKVFYALTAEEKDSKDVLSNQDAEYNKVDRVCKEIFNKQNKNKHIKDNFPDVGQEIVQEIDNGSLFITTPEKLRNVLLARRSKRRLETFFQKFIKETDSGEAFR